jgi:hypothetical protein
MTLLREAWFVCTVDFFIRCSCSVLHAKLYTLSHAVVLDRLSFGGLSTLLHVLTTTTPHQLFRCVQTPKRASRPPCPFPIRSSSISTLSKAGSTSYKCLGLCTGRTSILPIAAQCRSCK